MLDAPVSGSVPQVEAGTLTIMVGGDEQAYARVEPLLRELGTPTHIGENGQGLVLKLAINISLAVQMLAFAEGLVLAERAGIDPKLAVEVMTESAIGSPMLKARAAACPRPAGRGLVRRRPDAERRRARARHRTGAARAAAIRRGSRRGAHDCAGIRLRAARPGGALRGARAPGKRPRSLSSVTDAPRHPKRFREKFGGPFPVDETGSSRARGIEEV